MAGLYIHIPFCRKACTYCDFHFSISLGLKNEMLRAIEKEIEQEKHYLEGESLKTIYFGGGTPSILNATEITSIINTIEKNYRIQPEPEITLEANPDDLDDKYLSELSGTPVNRLSIGIQSFFDDDLLLMDRRHDSKQAIECVDLSRHHGFDNLSIDLIYGLPGSNQEKWEKTLETAGRLRPPHISAYHLTYEPGTMLDYSRIKKKFLEKDENESLLQFKSLIQYLDNEGYEHYEISNFSLPGKQSRHNVSYWNEKKYLGVGPSAHSFDGKKRRWNIAKNVSYIRGIDSGKKVYEEETLDTKDRFNEYLMTALRTANGISTIAISDRFGKKYLEHFEKNSAAFIASGRLLEESGRIFLDLEGKFIADYIIRELFMD